MAAAEETKGGLGVSGRLAREMSMQRFESWISHGRLRVRWNGEDEVDRGGGRVGVHES